MAEPETLPLYTVLNAATTDLSRTIDTLLSATLTVEDVDVVRVSTSALSSAGTNTEGAPEALKSAASDFTDGIDVWFETTGTLTLTDTMDPAFLSEAAPTAPVPLPAGLPLVLTSLGALAWMRRKALRKTEF